MDEKFLRGLEMFRILKFEDTITTIAIIGYMIPIMSVRLVNYFLFTNLN